MSDGEQADMVVDEEELFSTTQPLAPLSPLGHLETSDGPRQNENLDDLRNDQEVADGEENEKEKVKKVRKPRVALNEDRLIGKNGIRKLPEQFKRVRFKGKGYEKQDLDLLLREMEHWAHKLIPKQQFTDVVDKLELLGAKKLVKLHAQDIQRGVAIPTDKDDTEVMFEMGSDGSSLNRTGNIGQAAPRISAERASSGSFDDIGDSLTGGFSEVVTDDYSREIFAE